MPNASSMRRQPDVERTMNRLVAKLLFALVAVVGSGAVIYYFTRSPAKVETTPPEIVALQSRGTAAVPRSVLTEISEKAGIHFTHSSGATGRKLLPETMGSGCAFLDFDNDGRPDLLLINGRPWPGSKDPAPTMKLYRNKGDGNFEDVTAAVGLDIPLYGMGVCVGDFDNDGFTDIYVTAIGGCKLFRNEGGKHFKDVTDVAGVGGDGKWPANMSAEEFMKSDLTMPWPTSATFLDYDGDGKLDLFVCQYLKWSPRADLDNKFTLDGKTRGYGRPQQFEGTQCILYRNKGDGTFED